MNKDTIKVFLSHSSQDKDIVRAVALQLNDAGIPCWLDESEIKIGESLIRKLSEAIEQTSHVIVFLSQASVASSWVKFEVEQAMTKEVKGKKLIVLPVLLEKCDVPLYLSHKVYANFSDPRQYDDQFFRLVNSIKPGVVTSTDMPIGASRARLLLEDRLKKRYIELLAIARNFYEQNDSSGAKKVLREAIDLIPYAAGPYVNLGLIFASEGKQSEAKQCWAEALKRDPNSETALFNLGVFHMNNSNFREAKDYFQRAIDKNGENAERAKRLLKSLRAHKGKWIT